MGWSWWTTPRAVWEATSGQLLVGSVDNTGRVFVHSYDPSTGLSWRSTLADFEGDDHNNPALAAQAGRPLVAFYSRHALDGSLRYRKSIANVDAENPVQHFSAEATVTFLDDAVTYAVAQNFDAEIHVWVRCAQRYWEHVRSEDWAATWGTPQRVFDGVEGVSPVHLYCAFAHVGGADETVRVAMACHPSQTVAPGIYYATAGLVSGDVGTPALGVLGNLYTGTGLPLKRSEIDKVWTPPTNWRSWIWSVGSGATPEVVWQAWDPDDDGVSYLYYAALVGGEWQVSQVCETGPGFNLGDVPGDEYHGGAQFTAAGVLLLSRQQGSTWTIEKWTTVDNGASWSSAVLVSSTDKLIRPWNIENPTGAMDYVYQRATHFGEPGDGSGYLDWEGSIVVAKS